MRIVDAAACSRVGDVTLMRAAGVALSRIIPAHVHRVITFAGSGNNGGDGFAALAELDKRIERIVYAMPTSRPSTARTDAELRALASGVTIRPLPLTLPEAQEALAGVDIALDALLGVGTHSVPKPVFHPAITALCEVKRATRVIAVDLPTGVDPTTGRCAPTTVRADLTLTLGVPKLGLFFEPARSFVGELRVGHLPMEEEIAEGGEPSFDVLTASEFLHLIPRRPAFAEKRTAGVPLIIAGSAQFPGAAVLCARAAARSGAGYVTVATPIEAAALLRGHLVEQVVVSYDPRDTEGSIHTLTELLKRAGSLAIGPGLNLDLAEGEILRGVITRTTLPLVLDAGAFSHLAGHLELLREKRCVLTPHDGEFARLSGEGPIAEGTRLTRLRSFVERTGIVTLLKGATTLIDDGKTTHVNSSATQALATAGTGDVLTGMIATLLSQGLTPVDAARVAAHWHGLAGRACTTHRPIGVIAGDVADILGAALATEFGETDESLIMRAALRGNAL